LNSADGTLKCKFQSGGEIDNGAPTIGSGGTVYVGSSDHKTYAIGAGG